MKYNVPDRVFREITAFAQQNNVQKVILFGSRARGTHTLLTFDIVQLDERTSMELIHEIERDGVVLYEKN